MCIVQDTCNKHNLEEFDLFLLFEYHNEREMPRDNARHKYEAYTDFGRISDEMTDFCISVFVGQIPVIGKARKKESCP